MCDFDDRVVFVARAVAYRAIDRTRRKVLRKVRMKIWMRFRKISLVCWIVKLNVNRLSETGVYENEELAKK